MTPIFDCQTGERLVAEETVTERFIIVDNYSGSGAEICDSRQEVEDYLRENFDAENLDYRLANGVQIYSIGREVNIEVKPIEFTWS